MNPTSHDIQDVVLQVEGLSKAFDGVAVFANVHLQVCAGECVALLGESGVGKSTLLNVMAGLETADAGRVSIAGQEVTALHDDGRAQLRREHLGFVFQAFHVLPHLDVAENVGLPLRLLGRRDDGAVAAMLEAVGLQGLGARMPAQLSGGQLQRVAIARALIHRPALVLADEPTGNLDPGTAERVLSVLLAQAHQQGAACLIVTHSQAAARRADRICRLTPDGVIEATDSHV